MANEQEILSGLAEIVNEIAGVPLADIQPEKSFTDDLDVDSLSMVEVAMAAEEKFGVKIPDDDAYVQGARNEVRPRISDIDGLLGAELARDGHATWWRCLAACS